MSEVLVPGPGIYPDLPEDVYLADTALAPELGRSLSQSGAKRLLDCPARFAYEREHTPEPKAVFDLGHLVHGLLLGRGAPVVVIPADDWTRRADQAARREAREAGKIPVLAREWEAANTAAEAVRAHPTAGPALSRGAPETSLYWVHEETGVTVRARLDHWHPNAIVDVKTTPAGGATASAFARSAANFGYHLQDAFYRTGVAALTGEALPFVFVVVEREPPHLTQVFELDEDARALGAARMREALTLYAECESSGVFPGYPELITPLALPRWAFFTD